MSSLAAQSARSVQLGAVRVVQHAVADRVGLVGVPVHTLARTSVWSLVRQRRGPHLKGQRYNSALA